MFLSFVFSAIILFIGLLAVLYAIHREKPRFNLYIAVVSTFFAAISVFVPIYFEYFSTETNLSFRVLKTILLSVHNSIRLFVVDGEYDIIRDFVYDNSSIYAQSYSVLAAIIYVLAPVLTFGFVISVFSDLISQTRLLFRRNKEYCVFSDLNERSLALAKDLKENRNKKRVIVFSEVKKDYTDEKEDVIWKAKKLSAILIKKDITDIPFLRKRGTGNVVIYIMGDDEDENILQTIQLIRAYKDCSNVTLYLVSGREEADTLGSYLSEQKTSRAFEGMRFYRVDPALDMIYNLLYDKGKSLFENAVKVKTDEKKIGVVVLGLGKYGFNMVKTLSWYLQMDGYISEINAFDENNDSLDKFTAICPELMDDSINGRSIEGESQYDIKIHSNINVNSIQLYKKLEELDVISYVFISLGSDELNLKVARDIRSWTERKGHHPIIQTITYHEEIGDVMKEMKNHKDQTYDVEFIDDLKSIYREKVLMHTELQNLALKSHVLRGNSPEDFWNNWYNYRSSITSVMRMKARCECGVPGAEGDPSEMTEDQLRKIQILEHKGWNAYIRSIGYVKSDKTDHLAKTHRCLVPFDELDDEIVKAKDLITISELK